MSNSLTPITMEERAQSATDTNNILFGAEHPPGPTHLLRQRFFRSMCRRLPGEFLFGLLDRVLLPI